MNGSYSTPQSEDSVTASSLVQLDPCQASRRHLEECSVCSRQTSSIASENSQLLGSIKIEPNPEWPAPVFRPRPQFFQSALTDVSRPCTPQLLPPSYLTQTVVNSNQCNLAPQVNNASQCYQNIQVNNSAQCHLAAQNNSSQCFSSPGVNNSSQCYQNHKKDNSSQCSQTSENNLNQYHLSSQDNSIRYYPDLQVNNSSQCYLSPQVNNSSQSYLSPQVNNSSLHSISPLVVNNQDSPRQATTTIQPPKHYVQLTNNSPRITYLPTLTKLHPHTQVLFTEAGTQTDINISNGVSCLTTAKLLLGVVLSAVGFVTIIFVMKCKFRIGFQMNMCYYI